MPVYPQAAASPPPKVNNVPKKIHSYAPPFHPTTEFSAHHHQRSLVSTLQPLQMTSLQSNFIEDTMKEIRERQAKRQKVCGTMRMMVQRQDGASVEMCSQHDDGRHQGSPTGISLLDRLARAAYECLKVTFSLLTNWPPAASQALITRPASLAGL